MPDRVCSQEDMAIGGAENVQLRYGRERFFFFLFELYLQS